MIGLGIALGSNSEKCFRYVSSPTSVLSIAKAKSLCLNVSKSQVTETGEAEGSHIWVHWRTHKAEVELSLTGNRNILLESHQKW